MSAAYSLGSTAAFSTLGLYRVKYAAGFITGALNDLTDDYIDINTGLPPSEHEVALKQLGIAAYPNIVQKHVVEQALAQMEGAKTSAWKYAGGGPLLDDIPRESPEYHLPPARVSRRHGPLLSDPGFGDQGLPPTSAVEKANQEPIPGDNERSGGGDGGGSAALSRGGAEVPVPDQTPQRQAMSLYDSSSQDTPSIWRNFDSRLQNPATNSIVRFVSE